MGKYIMALDQGTTSSRCILFDKKGNILQRTNYEVKMRRRKITIFATLKTDNTYNYDKDNFS